MEKPASESYVTKNFLIKEETLSASERQLLVFTRLPELHLQDIVPRKLCKPSIRFPWLELTCRL